MTALHVMSSLSVREGEREGNVKRSCFNVQCVVEDGALWCQNHILVCASFPPTPLTCTPAVSKAAVSALRASSTYP